MRCLFFQHGWWLSAWLNLNSWVHVCVTQTDELDKRLTLCKQRTRPNPGHPRQKRPSSHIYPWKQPYTFSNCLEIKFKCVNLVFYTTVCIMRRRIITIEEENMAANTDTCTENSFKNCILLIYFQCSTNRTQTQKIEYIHFNFNSVFILSILGNFTFEVFYSERRKVRLLREQSYFK